jgi:hypothetical protein
MKTLNKVDGPFKLMEKEAKEWLDESFIKPLESLGFHLTHYSQFSDNRMYGLHYLIFQHNGTIAYRHQWVNDICVQDDDSQPKSSYTLYLDNLFLSIPYCL